MSNRRGRQKAEWPLPSNQQQAARRGRKPREGARAIAASEIGATGGAGLPWTFAQGARPELLTVEEVGAYLRLKSRSIYELARTNRIPCCKVTGKLLFPKRSIDLWLARSMNDPRAGAHLVRAPAVMVGSSDALLEWSLRESECGLAFLGCGGDDGLARISAGEAIAAGTTLWNAEVRATEASGELIDLDCVVIEWARREQGLIVAPSKANTIRSIADLRGDKIRIAATQPSPAADFLLAQVNSNSAVGTGEVEFVARPSHTDAGTALIVRNNVADIGFATRAAAREASLAFIPLLWERYDLVVRRIEYFEAPMQKLLAFIQRNEFRAHASAMSGYNVTDCGRVIFNARK